jgi:hypothetical protein
MCGQAITSGVPDVLGRNRAEKPPDTIAGRTSAGPDWVAGAPGRLMRGTRGELLPGSRRTRVEPRPDWANAAARPGATRRSGTIGRELR